MLDALELPFFQRGLAEVVLLAVACGTIGVWVVLRGLAFFAHALGTAAFPGLVLASGLGFAPVLGAFGTGLIFAGAVRRLDRDGGDYDAYTGLVLVGALAVGVILASDVFHSGGEVESLLFGSLLAVDGSDIALAGATAALALIATIVAGHRWLATGFDSQRSSGASGARWPEALLLVLVALCTVAVLSIVGALLATALLIVPAATARLLTNRMGTWQATAVALAAAEGVAGLFLSYETNAPPGATIAVLAGAVFTVVALAYSAGPRVRLAAAALLGAALLAGCGDVGGNSSGSRVVATTPVLADLVRAVGGNAVAVHQLLSPNSDPHEYEPRPSDVRETAAARVVFLSGDNLDSWMGDVVHDAGGAPKVVDLSKTLPVRLAGEQSGPEASRYDPHWWHDPKNVAAAVRRIRDVLAAELPDKRARIERNAATYLRRLLKLDVGITTCMGRVPAGERKLVTDHDAFGYFAHRYGITVVGAVIPSQSTNAQPSAGEVSKLTDVIRREHVKAVFPESSINPRLARSIAGATGARADFTLYGDTLGPAGSRGSTYLRMEQANADAMTQGFSGGRVRCRIAGVS